MKKDKRKCILEFKNMIVLASRRSHGFQVANIISLYTDSFYAFANDFYRLRGETKSRET